VSKERLKATEQLDRERLERAHDELRHEQAMHAAQLEQAKKERDRLAEQRETLMSKNRKSTLLETKLDE